MKTDQATIPDLLAGFPELVALPIATPIEVVEHLLGGIPASGGPDLIAREDIRPVIDELTSFALASSTSPEDQEAALRMRFTLTLIEHRLIERRLDTLDLRL